MTHLGDWPGPVRSCQKWQLDRWSHLLAVAGGLLAPARLMWCKRRQHHLRFTAARKMFNKTQLLLAELDESGTRADLMVRRGDSYG